VALARGVLVLFALVLPFEAPLFRAWVLQITSVELALYATLLAWVVAAVAHAIRAASLAGQTPWSAAAALRLRVTGALRTDAAVQAATLWAVALVVCAVAAPSYRGPALKFAARSLSGILVFFATRSLASSPETRRRVVLALLAGGMVSAVAALVEWSAPDAPVWSVFRVSGFDAFGLNRATGPFAYPTIGGMYWEASIPLAVVVPLVGRLARRRSVIAVSVCACLPLAAAIVASGTRSALAGGSVACVGLVALGWRLGSPSVRPGAAAAWAPVRRAAAAALVVLAVTSSLAVRGIALVGQRLAWWQDTTWFRVEYDVGACPTGLRVEEAFSVPVLLRNTGSLPWQRSGPRPFRLGYHWEPAGRAATLGDFEGRRTDLPADVPPGGSIHFVASAQGPSQPGDYRLRWDLVQEHVTWFSERGNQMPAQAVVVQEAAQGPPAPEVGAADSAPVIPPAQPPPSRLRLWAAALTLWRERPLLGIGPDNFRRRYSDAIGLDPTGHPYSDNRMHANSFYLETLADLGVVGIAALAWMVVALARSLRALSRSGCLEGVGCGTAAATFFVHGCFDYFLEFTPLFALFWMLLGLTAAHVDGLPRGAPEGNRA
jgi:hypothetical protein